MVMTLVMLVVLAPVGASAAAAGIVVSRAQPEVRSHAFYILDESDSSVLAARHERVPVPIASITKLMTALVVLEAPAIGQQDFATCDADLPVCTGEINDCCHRAMNPHGRRG